MVVRPPRKRTKQRKQQRKPRRSLLENASALSSSTPTGLQSNADLHWLADTGATSHMTPHYAWMRNYTPYVVDIHLADNTIVQSAGIGSVVLNPVVDSSDARPVELTRVLMFPNCAIIYDHVFTSPNAKESSWKWTQAKFASNATERRCLQLLSPHTTQVLWMLQLSSIQSLLRQLQLFQWTSTFGIDAARTTVT